MRFIQNFMAAAFAGATLIIAPQASASLIGVAVDPNDPTTQVGETEVRADLGGAEAIRYFIPLGNDSGIYGVSDNGDFGLTSDTGNGGGTLSMFLAFGPIVSGAEYTLDILFEDLDLDNANDPVGFLESINILSVDGMTSFSGGTITDIASLLVTGDSDTQQLLTLFIGAIVAEPFIIRLDFQASFTGYGRNTPEFLIATLNEVPIPAALPLFLAGIAGLGFAGRGKKAKPQLT